MEKLRDKIMQDRNIKLLGCPFCGSVPYFPTNLKKKKQVTSCPNPKCPIHGIDIATKQWNFRARTMKALEILKEKEN